MPLRWIGFVPVALAIVWAAGKPLPDVLIAADGRGFAVRGADGRLALHHSGGDSFAVREWLAADADGRDVHDKGLGQGIACDQSGCIGKLADGTLTGSRRRLMRKTVGGWLLSSPPAAIRRRIAGPKSFRARYGVSAARWRCAAN
jgi:hypothetical protein